MKMVWAVYDNTTGIVIEFCDEFDAALDRAGDLNGTHHPQTKLAARWKGFVVQKMPEKQARWSTMNHKPWSQYGDTT